MDKEMIERCAQAMSDERFKLINKPLGQCYKELTVACIKAMREPTEKMKASVGYDNEQIDSYKIMIDAVIND